MANAILTAERVRELLSYDPESGVLSWRFSRSGISAGPAGCASSIGYIYLTVDGTKQLAHRLAWLITHGEWPSEDIDHINGVRADNRLANLRAVPRYVNNENRRKVRADNKVSGATGVTWHHHSRKWIARIHVRKKVHRLGLFDTVEEASAAYLEAKRRLHKGCTI